MRALTLTQHRENLLKNPNRYTEDEERAKNRMVTSMWNYYRSEIKKVIGRSPSTARNDIKSILGTLSDLIWKAQDGKPLFEISSNNLFFAWNHPGKGWDIDFIKYEIGHLKSRNHGGDERPSNLSFQSARCNHHIQTSMNIEDVLFLLRGHSEVINRCKNLDRLHESDEWLQYIEKISNIIEELT